MKKVVSNHSLYGKRGMQIICIHVIRTVFRVFLKAVAKNVPAACCVKL